MKKYEITDIAHPDNPNLHRIRAVTDLTEDVLAGMLGGYVESYDNLDQEGRAWISEDAIACENMNDRRRYICVRFLALKINISLSCTE